jgi:hypothetical protein
MMGESYDLSHVKWCGWPCNKIHIFLKFENKIKVYLYVNFEKYSKSIFELLKFKLSMLNALHI